MNIGEKISATVVTGFLGAGKTTLIRNLILSANGKRIALIVNEFGDMGFDGSLINSECNDSDCQVDELIELNNGCICCTVAEDFLPTMEQLLTRDPLPDHIVIETSGLALPQPLVRAFQWPSVRNKVTVDGVITVVDSAALSAGRVAFDEEAVANQRLEDSALDHEDPIEELFRDQIRCADMIVLNKVDLIEGSNISKIVDRIDLDRRDKVQILEAKHGKIPPTVLLGMESESESDMDSRLSLHESHHSNGEDLDHHHDDFDSKIFTGSKFRNLDHVREIVEKISAYPGILRVKGKVVTLEKEAPVIVQAVGPNIQTWYGTPDEAETGLVVIGLGEISNDISNLFVFDA